jgi:hypothetical protein
VARQTGRWGRSSEEPKSLICQGQAKLEWTPLWAGSKGLEM